jgi:hypothetical protein
VLDDPAYTVPPPGPPGPLGTIAWLRATVSRFSEGEVHARRRAIAEALLAELDPEELRGAARDAAASQPRTAEAPPTAVMSVPPRQLEADGRLELRYVPVAVLAEALGAREVPETVAAVRVVAAAYHPSTDAPGADAAVARLLELLPREEPERAAQRIALLVQACEATAALVRGDDLPVPATKRIGPDGELHSVSLAGHPFGYGRRPCPGERHALALAAGTLEA